MMLLHLKVEEHPHCFPREGGLPVGPPQLGKTSSRKGEYPSSGFLVVLLLPS